MSKGIPPEMSRRTLVVPFNDVDAVRSMLDERGTEIACLIMEPVMMNIGVVLPDPGYLEAVRDLCTERGVVLIFDEVKSGATIAEGGATERFGVQPDLACFAKAIGGGVPTGAFGGRADVMAVIEHGAAQQGTFNGNPLAAAAGLAALTEVLTKEAYVRFTELGSRLADGCRGAVEANGIPAHAVDLGCKGCVSYRPDPLRNYRDFLETNVELFAASWPWMVNRGIFMTPGDEEQWTLSAQHSEEDVDAYLDAFGAFCEELAR
jgi:glutamate-1-semialdehyde 2,1-aminomutase